MIKSFKHRGLEKYFYNDDKSRINPEHTARITRILDRLDASVKPQDMNLPGYKLHKLFGKAKDTWSVWVSGNWRITFKFDKNNAVDVDYRDYH
jgi:toxin HigB-1